MYHCQDVGKHFLAMFLTAVLAGCAQTTSTAPAEVASTPAQGVAQEDEQNLSPEQRELRALERSQEQQEAAFNRTILEGLMTGISVGGLLGRLPWGDSVGWLRAATVGSAVGAPVGALTAKYVTAKQRRYVREEDRLNSVIADVRQLNTENQVMLDKMRQVLAENQSQVARLKAQYEGRKISQEQYQRQLATIRSDHAVMTRMVQRAENRLTVFREAKGWFKEVYPAADFTGLSTEVENSQATIKAMQQVANDLAVVA